MSVELYHDNFQNFKRYNIPKAQLVIADIPADIVFMAVNKAIGCCKYPPSICEVKEKLRTLHWDAYSMLDDRVNAISETARAEYQRIYEATKQFKIMKTEPDLNELLINNSQRYLLG